MPSLHPLQVVTVFAEDYPELSRGDLPPCWLSTAEEAVLRGMRFPARRRKWLLGRIAAKLVVGNLLETRDGTAPPQTEIVIGNRSSGQPYATVCGEPFDRPISISHRDPIGVAAVGEPGTSIGVDLERVEPRDPALVGDFFTEREAEAVAAARGRDATVLVARTWSGKEAVLKALGLGLRRDTRTIEVGPELPGPDRPLPLWRPLEVTLSDPPAGTISLSWSDWHSYLLTLAIVA